MEAWKVVIALLLVPSMLLAEPQCVRVTFGDMTPKTGLLCNPKLLAKYEAAMRGHAKRLEVVKRRWALRLKTELGHQRDLHAIELKASSKKLNVTLKALMKASKRRKMTIAVVVTVSVATLAAGLIVVILAGRGQL